MAEAVGEARIQHDPHIRKAMLEFEHDKALRQADFATPYKSATNLPLGEEPLLVTRLRAQPDGNGSAVLSLHPTQGQGMDLAMDAMLLHSFTRLLQGAVGKTDWDIRLDLPRAPTPANQQTPPRALATFLMSSRQMTVLPTPAPPKSPIFPPLR